MQNMDPVFRDEYVEDVLESLIRGPEGEPDVTEWMNNSGEGDPELAPRDGSGEAHTELAPTDGSGEAHTELAPTDGSGEGEAYELVAGEANDSHEREANDSHEREVDGSDRTLQNRNSDEVHVDIYIYM